MRFVVLAISVLLARPALAETIAVASSDTGFIKQLTATLASAGFTASPAQVTWRETIADLTGDVRALADQEHATATIALVFSTADATLITYDRALDRMLLRVLPYRTPLSEAQSAESARMARAMLRALRVTPEVDLPPPHASEAAAIRQRAIATVASVPEVSRAELLALELGAGIRFGAVGDAANEEGAVGLVVRPDAVGGVVSAIIVPSGRVAAPGFMGTVSDTSLAASARLPLHVAQRIAVAATAGFAVHRIHLTGAADGGAIDVTRYDPALRAGIDVRYELSSGLEVGASASLEGLLRYQDYTVAGVQVLDVPAARLGLELSVLARIL